MAPPSLEASGFHPLWSSKDRARVPWVDRLEYAVRSRGAKVVVLALVANTMVAQLLYNSAGQLVLSSAFLLGYLLFSAVCSTVAFALFEVSTIFQLHDLHTLDASIKNEIGADKLIRRGYLVLVVSSLINFLSVLYFLALAWHSTSGSPATFPLDNLPSPWNWLYYAVHALAYTLVLFLAGIYGERPTLCEGSRARHATSIGTASVGTLAATDRSQDRGHDASGRATRRSGGCAGLA